MQFNVILGEAFGDFVVTPFPECDLGFRLGAKAGFVAQDFLRGVEVDGVLADGDAVGLYPGLVALTRSFEFIFESCKPVVGWSIRVESRMQTDIPPARRVLARPLETHSSVKCSRSPEVVFFFGGACDLLHVSALQRKGQPGKRSSNIMNQIRQYSARKNMTTGTRVYCLNVPTDRSRRGAADTRVLWCLEEPPEEELYGAVPASH